MRKDSPGIPGKATRWQRVIAAGLAVGGGGVFLHDLFVRGLSTWLEGVVAAGALYGAYLFGYFALWGTLPTRLRTAHRNICGDRPSRGAP